MGPKYSIVIPTYNAVKYLKQCIQTILSIDYSDYELIISDNCSTDDTEAYLQTLNHPNIKIIKPKTHLSLGESWDFAIAHTSGEWVYGIGSDDGVLPYFFKLADILTDYARAKNLHAVKTNRVYYFHYNAKVQEKYGNSFISFFSEPKVCIHSTKNISEKVLYESDDYFFCMPQMYTSSMFHRCVLDKIYNQTKKYVNVMAQDISLGASFCILEEKYLYCDIPLAWVGTSSCSYGFMEGKRKEISIESYKRRLEENSNSLLGINNPYDYSYISGITLMHAEALRYLSNIGLKGVNSFNAFSKENYKKLFANIYVHLDKNLMLKYFETLIKQYGLSLSDIQEEVDFINKNANKVTRCTIFFKIKRKVKNIVNKTFFSWKRICFEIKYNEDEFSEQKNMTIEDVNGKIKKLDGLEKQLKVLKIKLNRINKDLPQLEVLIS